MTDLPKALEYFKPPFKYERGGQTIYCIGANGDQMALQVRGWGNLIGGGANALDHKVAENIQDEFGEWVASLMNNAVKDAPTEPFCLPGCKNAATCKAPDCVLLNRDVLAEKTRTAISDMNAQTENVIRSALPTAFDIERVSCVVHAETKVATYSYNGVPFIEIHDLHFDQVRDKGGFRITASRAYRLL